MLFHINRIERTYRFSVCSCQPLTGICCNAYKQEVDEGLSRIHMHPARHKPSRHPYDQMTYALCDWDCWNMRVMSLSYKRQVKTFSQLILETWSFYVARSNIWRCSLSRHSSRLIAGVALPRSSGLNCKCVMSMPPVTGLCSFGLQPACEAKYTPRQLWSVKHSMFSVLSMTGLMKSCMLF